MDTGRDHRMTVELKPGERLDDLQFGTCRLIQRADAFRFGTDSVILADFAAPRRKDMAVDLGCGTGAVATLMALHAPSITIDAVELQPDIADMALRSTRLNGLEQRLRIHQADMRVAWRLLGAERYTLAVCNPPYHRNGCALPSETETDRTSRHEGELTPEAIAAAAGKLLRTGGRFCVVYPAQRAFEMLRAMDRSRLAPKRIRTVHGKPDRAPKLILIEAVKGGGEQLHWLPPLILQSEDGSFTEEWHRIYRT